MRGGAIHGVRAAFYDLDGTLFDSVSVWGRIDSEFLARHGLTPTVEYKRKLAGMGNRRCAEYTVEYYGLPVSADEVIAEWSALAKENYSDSVRLTPGAREYIERTAAAGIAQYALSSLSPELAEPCLKNNGISEYMTALISTDRTGLPKTDPGIYLLAADMAGAAPDECVMFDDVVRALRAAKRAGLRTVAMRGPCGYDDGETLCAGDADTVASDFWQAPVLIAKGRGKK